MIRYSSFFILLLATLLLLILPGSLFVVWHRALLSHFPNSMRQNHSFKYAFFAFHTISPSLSVCVCLSFAKTTVLYDCDLFLLLVGVVWLFFLFRYVRQNIPELKAFYDHNMLLSLCSRYAECYSHGTYFTVIFGMPHIGIKHLLIFTRIWNAEMIDFCSRHIVQWAEKSANKIIVYIISYIFQFGTVGCVYITMYALLWYERL